MSEHEAAAGAADPVTLAALGILAYVAETLLHEAVGHGVMCMAAGGRIEALAPLYLSCSAASAPMVAAGPAMNVLAGLASLIALRATAAGATAGAYFLWLSLIFNWLVACGYVLVGAATGFGDWAVLFSGVRPDWMWRVPAGIGALLLYVSVLRLASREFAALTGLSDPDLAAKARLILVPTGAAAAVALAAEARQGAAMGLALAFGCTFFVGLTLLGVGTGSSERQARNGALRIRFNGAIVIAALAVAAVFILVVGPGADLSWL